MAAPKSVACPGFRFAGIVAGIKNGMRPDLALVLADKDVPTAAVFTQNQVRAAPVKLSETRVRTGLARAIVINSGNANACTGPRGDADAARMAADTAAAIGCKDKSVLVASTGVIGQPLPIDRVSVAVPRLVAAARADGLDQFTRAIMTTDKFEKRALGIVSLGPKSKARIVGVCKGAGMIAPNMATMLAFVTTDAAVEKSFLRKVLREIADETFNTISVDGDTSTNDSLFLMASGAAKNRPIAGGKAGAEFRATLRDVLEDLSRQIVRDGEGATHVVTIEVMGAPKQEAGERLARRIAASPLVKTALFGADPNWGRVLCAIGASDVKIRPDKIDIAFGPVQLVKNGVGVGAEAEKAREVMRLGEYSIFVHLHNGSATARHTTCDLGHEYVRINADYRS